MTIVRKQEKVRVNITLDPVVKRMAKVYLADRYNISLSEYINKVLADFNNIEKRKVVDHPDQGCLI